MQDMTGEYINNYDLVTGYVGSLSEFSCPVCGSRGIQYIDTDYEVPEKIVNEYVCNECGSEFEFHYVFEGAFVNKDGRKA